MTILNQESSSTEKKNKKFHRFVSKEGGLIDGVDLGVNGSITRSRKNEARWTLNYLPVHMHTYYGFLINISCPFDLDFAKFSVPDHIISLGENMTTGVKTKLCSRWLPLEQLQFLLWALFPLDCHQTHCTNNFSGKVSSMEEESEGLEISK